MNDSASAVDLEIFRNLFVSIADEMGTVLRKTAFSANIKKRRDYSCAVYGAKGETIAMGDHMPVHLGAMPLSVQHVLEAFKLKPGDVAIVNDPFRSLRNRPGPPQRLAAARLHRKTHSQDAERNSGWGVQF
jgi:N-methylhydantoinase B/oxoprolinase/acetone carboxylase alpha subunit